MKSRGFTLLELVIVIVLLGISSVFSMRFIADMASGHVNSVERGQSLAGARFMMERLRRELSIAYSPSVYIETDAQQQCVAFVPVTGAGRYQGVLGSASTSFILPVELQDEALESGNLAIKTPKNTEVNQWLTYPDTLPDGVAKINQQTKATGQLSWEQAFGEDPAVQPDFSNSSNEGRYTLLEQQQVRFCLHNQGTNKGEIRRQLKKADSEWTPGVLMLNNVKVSEPFFNYNTSHQLLTVNLAVHTTDGVLALPSQMQVNYEP